MLSMILDKITLPKELPRISRIRLLNALEESMNCCTSTVIYGRTGMGKTMLATDFAGRCGRRVAWYKVDAPEVDIQSFLQYLVASVRTQHPGFGRKTLALLSNVRTTEDVAMLAESFVYEMLMLENSEPLLLVVDDLHLVYDAEWVVPFFHRLLPLLPAEAHMVIIGRTLPPAPLWRMRSKQTLCVVDESALLFTMPEAQELFAGYHLNNDQVTRAFNATGGRAAALDAIAREYQEAVNRAEPVDDQTKSLLVSSKATR